MGSYASIAGYCSDNKLRRVYIKMNGYGELYSNMWSREILEKLNCQENVDGFFGLGDENDKGYLFYLDSTAGNMEEIEVVEHEKLWDCCFIEDGVLFDTGYLWIGGQWLTLLRDAVDTIQEYRDGIEPLI